MNFPGTGLPTGGGSNGVDDPNVKRVQALMESCFAKTAMSGVAGFGLGGIFGMFMASMSYDTPYHTAVPTPSPAAGAAGASGTAATAGASGAVGAAVAAGKPAVSGAVASTVAPTATTTASTTTAAATAAKALPKTAPAAVASAASAISTAAASAPAAVLTPETISSLPLRQQLAYGFRDMGSRSYSTAKNFGKVGALFSGIECGIEGLRAKNDMGNGVAAGCLTGAILARNGGPQAAAIGCAGFAAFSAAIDAYMRMPPSDD